TEFKFNILVTLARIHLEKGFPAKWRVIKSRIRTKYLKDAGSIEEAKKRCPDGFDQGNWELFVIRENDPNVIAINKQNADNRKRNLSDFCGGRQSYAQKLYLMDKASPEKQHGRVDEQVKLAHERITSSTSNEEGIDNYIDLNSDALVEVFSPEKKTYTRGVCSYTSKKQVLMHQVSSNAASGVQPPPSTNTPQAEVGSNSAHRPSQPSPQNLMNLFDHVDQDRRSVVQPKVHNQGMLVLVCCQRMEATVRASAVSTLAKFGALVDSLKPRIYVLLRHCLYDCDDEVS
ncbi:hypothetical protein FRX31_004146, partial [Thalictrum thalictroides]